MTQGTRVYGSIQHDGLRHEASGVLDGVFAKTKEGWDTYTVCGKYVGVAVETDEDLTITCIRCLGRRRHSNYSDILRSGDLPRGYSADQVFFDEAQDFDYSKMTNPCGEIALSPTETADLVETIGNMVVAGVTRANGGTR